MNRNVIFTIALLFTTAGLASAQEKKLTREEKVRQDKTTVEADGFWIYNDLAAGMAEAKKSGKPMIVILRCIPCEECVKLDDDLVNKDKRVRPLLEKFVRVRLVSTNGLDLSLFQYDYDQSFAGFFLNGDGTIYGRFGTRSHRTYWYDDVSIDGLAKAMEGALELHKNYPTNKTDLAGRRGPAPLAASPEKFPTLSGKYGPQIDYAGKVVQSCIHCHQIGDAIKETYRNKNQPIPDNVLFSYPHPKTVGLILDPKERATVAKVEAGSPAEKSGFKAGDEIVKLGGQPLLSIADAQWVLQSAPDSGDLPAVVQRNGKTMPLTLALPKDWRKQENISWRSSSWGLRRMATGGLLLETMAAEEAAKINAPGKMALRVKHVGQFGAHAAAKNAGVQVGDILISFDGRDDLVRETDVLAHGVTARNAGDAVPVVLLRNGKKVELKIPMQK